MLNSKIDELKKKFLSFCRLVQVMVEDSIEGYISGNNQLLKKVIEVDEEKANNLEIEIDELCTAIIAQYEPRAKNLRIILMVLKINNDLERIGDLATNISESGQELLKSPLGNFHSEFKSMHKNVKIMIEKSIDCFVNEDAQTARDIIELDEKVDKMRYQILKDIIKKIIDNPEYASSFLHIERIAKSLERVGDLATNIAEDVVYVVEGENIKHSDDQ